ncbi:putative transferase At1g60990, chloroplastic [Selaginella moellendorffii]|uniref:putative transferase At1g60990, chloroplastic n=1 Tax=Selaginella moellendorffii TaxID=88036 RepID=UPI000D1CA5D8|nr:putative transferase At1g60990, chloroplastic [Selaginella moellendorffii]|eukprot:XP_002975902.2 putative transferase At1g60990, chloroplastic [Selaginella moellendorffii]
MASLCVPGAGAVAAAVPQARSLARDAAFSKKVCSRSRIHARILSGKFDARRVVMAAVPDVVPPPIENDLEDVLLETGAQISDNGIVQTFGNDEEALKAADSGCAVIEMSHFGRLRVTGDDRLRFLHNQSTADFLPLKDGEGCDTVFVTNTARTIDLATAWAMNTAVILLVSPETRHDLIKLLNKYIFFSDKVEVDDITEKTSYFSIVGPQSDNVMRQLKLESLIDKPYGTHVHYTANGAPVTVGVGSGLCTKGYSFLVSTAAAGPVWTSILKCGALPMGSSAWERLRILQGRPVPGKELTDEFNVLEAGLWRTISQTKGCYIGQETVARLITYNGVKQHLHGVKLTGAVEPGTILTTRDGVKAGKLTSCTREAPYFGLCYIRKQCGGPGLEIKIGDGSVTGILVQVPGLARELSSGSRTVT